MAEHLFWLPEAQFARLRPLLPDEVRGVPRADDRKVISGIVHVLKSGCRWADAPPEYGPRKTLVGRWRRWTEKGYWVSIFEALADEDGPPSQAMIDSSVVRARRSAAGGRGGACAGDRSFEGRAACPGLRAGDEGPRGLRPLVPPDPPLPDRRASPRLLRTSRPSRTVATAPASPRRSTATATRSNTPSACSRTSAASPPATTASPETVSQPSLSSAPHRLDRMSPQPRPARRADGAPA